MAVLVIGACLAKTGNVQLKSGTIPFHESGGMNTPKFHSAGADTK